MPDKVQIRHRRNTSLREGDEVTVARDIQRIPNPKNAEEREQFHQYRFNFWLDLVGHRPTCRPPCATFQPYAQEGEQGIILSFFGVHAKVRMTSGEIKTFRRTSLTLTTGSTSGSRP